MDAADDATDAGTGARVNERDVVNDETGSFIGGLGGHNLVNDLLAADGALEAEELNPTLLNERAARRFTGGDGAPTPPTVVCLLCTRS
jgi:hypothetical protein